MSSDLRHELQAIYDEHRKLTPSLVVDLARNPAHPLHDRFEWNDKVAGEKYRLDQARQLIRTLRVVYKEATEDEPARSTRAFHSIYADNGRTYRPVEEVVQDPMARELLLREMARDWKSMKRRYGHMVEFIALVQAEAESPEAQAS